MWGIAGIVLVGLVAALMEVPALIRRQWKRELLVFVILLVLGTVIGCAKVLILPIPNPADWVAALLKPFGDAIQKMLK